MIRFRRKDDGHDACEIEANAFAAELLMPHDHVQKDFENLYKSLEENLGKVERTLLTFIINSLADKYKVSNDAMKFRLANLSLISL